MSEGFFADFGFGWPWVLALLAALPLIVVAGRDAPDAGTALRLPFALPLGAASRAAGGRLRPSGVLICALLVVAAARPQWISAADPRPASGRDLLLVLDVSSSMGTRDLRDGARALSRLDAATQLGARFLAARPGDRAGLIVFGARPYLYVPLSYDVPAVRRALIDLAPGLAGETTAIGDALALAVRTLVGSPEDEPAQSRRPPASAAVVLVTDGAQNAGTLSTAQAAWLAARAGVRVHALAVGAATDAAGLTELAAQTGGVAVRATDGAAIAAFFDRLAALEPAGDPWGAPGARPRELYPLPLAAALLFLALASLADARAGMRGRRPHGGAR